MHVLVRDVDRTDRFVWFRGYPDMATRRDGPTRFYLGGAAWARHSRAASATMLDSDDVLLCGRCPVPHISARPCGRGRSRVVPNRPGSTPRRSTTCVRRPTRVCGAGWPGRVRCSRRAARTSWASCALSTRRTTYNVLQLPIRDSVDVLVVIARYGSHDERRALSDHLGAVEAGRRFADFEARPARSWCSNRHHDQRCADRG